MIETPVALAGGTKIEWADYTFNPWWGCARVSRACDGCYAEAWAKRTGHDVWGKHAARRLLSDANWRKPLTWDRLAERDGVRRRVFCASMADVFEARDDLDVYRSRLWDLIEATPHLDWFLLTKRPEEIVARVPASWIEWPDYWCEEFDDMCSCAFCDWCRADEPEGSVPAPVPWPHNVWVGTTVEDQRSAVTRIPHLQAVPAQIRFLSCEPLLERIEPDLTGISWVITGGETGPKARPSHPAWFRELRDRCGAAGTSFFFKQWGDWADGSMPGKSSSVVLVDGRSFTADVWRQRAGGLNGWRHQPVMMTRAGKKAAGRVLDGRTWDDFPG